MLAFVAVFLFQLFQLFQLLFTYWPPMQGLFGSAALSAGDWLVVFGAGLAVFLLVEAEKALGRRMGWLHAASR